MRQRHLDTLLLEQAYQASHLKQHLPNLSVRQIQLVIENASPAELEVIEEFVGGLKNIGKAAVGAAKKAGQAVAGAGKAAAAKTGQAIAGAGDAAKGAGKAVAAGAKQVGQNVKQMYQSGEDDAAAGKRKKQLQDHLGQLEQLFAQHIEASPSSRLKGKNLNELTLGQLKQALAGTKGVKERKATAAREQGFTGGVGDAAKAGYEAGSAPQQAAAGGAPAPAPA